MLGAARGPCPAGTGPGSPFRCTRLPSAGDTPTSARRLGKDPPIDRHVQWPVALNGPSSDDAWWVRQVHVAGHQRSHTAVVPGHGGSVGVNPSRS